MKLRHAAALSPIMTVKELAQYLRCHFSMIYRLIRKGELPFFKIGSDYRFNRDDIDKWIVERERSRDRSR